MISLCHYPTTVIFIDDDRDFLNNVSLHLQTNLSYKYYTNPQEGLNAVNAGLSSIDPLNQRLLSKSEATSDSIWNNEIKFGQIYTEIYNDNRFGEISAVIVDFEMPDLNGLDLLKKIKNNKIFKLLLTGVANEQIAIKAFNEGLINGYIKKQDPNFELELQQKIANYSKKYFEQFTSLSLASIIDSDDYPIAASEPQFEQFFYEVIEDLKITEYYQFEKVGSYLLIDEACNGHILHTQNEDQFTAFLLEIKSHINNDRILGSLKQRQKMVCLPITHRNSIYPHQWVSYLKPIEKVFMVNQGFHKLYCSLEKNINDLHLNDIYTFKLHLKHANPFAY